MDDTQALHHQEQLDQQEQEESFYKRFDPETGLYAHVHQDADTVFLTIGTYNGSTTFHLTGDQAKEIARHLMIKGDQT
jgi:5-keto 4-deoxyuronate isomerase